MQIYRYILRAASRNIMLRIICLLFVAVFLVPVFLSPLFLYDDAVMRQEVESAHQAMELNFASGVYDDFSDQSREELEREFGELSAMVGLDAGQEFYAHYAAYKEISLDRIERGDRIGNFEQEKALSVLAGALAKNPGSADEPHAGGLPVLYQLPYTYASLPILIWLIPSFAASVFVLHCFGKNSLFDAAPLSRVASTCGQLIAAAIVSLGIIALGCVPALIVGGLMNGLGSPDYPIVFWLGKTLVETTALEAFGWTALYLVLANVFILTVSIFGALILRHRFASVFVAFLCAVLSMSEGILSTGSLFAGIAAYLPITYLNASHLIGFVRCFPFFAQGVSLPISAEKGAVVLVISIAAVVAVAMTVECVCMAKATGRNRREASSRKECLMLWDATIGHGKSILLRVSEFNVRPREVYGLIGPNGMGKTTLLEALSGDRKCLRKGVVSANGLLPTNRAGFNSVVQFVPCDGTYLISDMTARDHLKMAKNLWRSPFDLDESMRFFGVDKFPDLKVGKMSLGMKQQLSCVLAYVSNAKYILLDEPINALDPENAQKVMLALRKMQSEGRGIVVSSHALEFIDSVCTELVTISGGKLVKRTEGESGDSAEFYFAHRRKESE